MPPQFISTLFREPDYRLNAGAHNERGESGGKCVRRRGERSPGSDIRDCAGPCGLRNAPKRGLHKCSRIDYSAYLAVCEGYTIRSFCVWDCPDLMSSNHRFFSMLHNGARDGRYFESSFKAVVQP